MSRPYFTAQEWQLIHRCCAPLRIDGRVLPYLRDFLALRLAGLAPRLAAKVRRLGDDHVRGLCQAVSEHQRAEEGDQVVRATREAAG
jgi:hypothetical protein